MHKIIITGSLLALPFALTACVVRTTTANSSASDAKDSIGQAGWTDGNVRALQDAIGRRADHGLDHLNFAVKASDKANLTQAALRYANALAHGASDPTKLYDIYTVPRPNPDLRRGLAQALAAGKLAAWFASLAPQTDSYAKLSKAYLALTKDAKAPAVSGSVAMAACG
ncbi:MAG TPA: hypothetical protein VF463_00160 [Sphingobium sp.]